MLDIKERLEIAILCSSAISYRQFYETLTLEDKKESNVSYAAYLPAHSHVSGAKVWEYIILDDFYELSNVEQGSILENVRYKTHLYADVFTELKDSESYFLQATLYFMLLQYRSVLTHYEFRACMFTIVQDALITRIGGPLLKAAKIEVEMIYPPTITNSWVFTLQISIKTISAFEEEGIIANHPGSPVQIHIIREHGTGKLLLNGENTLSRLLLIGIEATKD